MSCFERMPLFCLFFYENSKGPSRTNDLLASYLPGSYGSFLEVKAENQLVSGGLDKHKQPLWDLHRNVHLLGPEKMREVAETVQNMDPSKNPKAQGPETNTSAHFPKIPKAELRIGAPK